MTGSAMNPSEPKSHPPDRLNEVIGVLTRREVEARLMGPLINALGRRFGQAEVLEVLEQTIIRIGREQGEQLTDTMGGHSLECFAQSLEYWTREGALEIEVLEESETKFFFNVTRCRYAEMYHELGLRELGATLSCNRDFALITGFNPQISLTRTQTIMEGAPFCDFRYTLGGAPQTGSAA